jgi:hypothetical protein
VNVAGVDEGGVVLTNGCVPCGLIDLGCLTRPIAIVHFIIFD